LNLNCYKVSIYVIKFVTWKICSWTDTPKLNELRPRFKTFLVTFVDDDDNTSLNKKFLALKDELMRRWLEQRDEKISEQYEYEGALFSYLIPCYLTAFIKSNTLDAKGLVFFGSVLQQLLMKSSRLLDMRLKRPVEVPVRDCADLLAQMWELQNKVYPGFLNKVQIVTFA